MGVLDELLNDENTFSYDAQGYDAQDFRGMRSTLAPRQISQQTVIPNNTIVNPAAPSQGISVGTRSNVPISKALFDINIFRSRVVNADLSNVGSNTNTLPVILFGASQVNSQYVDILNNNSGLTFVGVIGGDIYIPAVTATPIAYNAPILRPPANAKRFIYLVSNGDPPTFVYVDVTCSQVSYPSLLKATESDIFRINYLKYFLPSGTVNTQFGRSFTYVEKSLFGKKGDDTIPVLSNVKATDFRDNLIELPLSLWVDKTKALRLEVGAEMENSALTLSFFVDYTHRNNV